MKIEMDSHSVYQVLSDSNASARGMLRARFASASHATRSGQGLLTETPGVRKRQAVPQRPDLARAPKSVYKDKVQLWFLTVVFGMTSVWGA